MKKTVGLLLCLVIPQIATARPATDPTLENYQLIHQAYEETRAKYEADFRICDQLGWDDPDYIYYAFWEKKGLLSENLPCQPETVLSNMTSRYFLEELIVSLDDSGFTRPKHTFENILRKIPRDDKPLDCQNLSRLEDTSGCKLSAPLTEGEWLRLIYDNLPSEYVYTQFDFNQKQPLQIKNQRLYYGEQPIKGIAVNWSVKPHFDRTFLKEEMEKMKAMGIVGIATEIGWDTVEAREDDYQFPDYFDDFLEIAEENGLHVNILLAGHYTPPWVMRKYGDIRMYTVDGRPVDDGSYMTFAPTAPALDDLAEFQAEAIRYYEKYPHVITFFLSNEQSYGYLEQLDYSDWARQAWQDYRLKHNLEPYDQAMPRSAAEPAYVDWQLFRQDMLNRYLNTLFDSAVAARTGDIPIGHKTIFYEATSAYSRDYGLYPTVTDLKQEIVGSDIYGYTPNVYPAQNAHQKPILVIETNLPGDWDDQAMYEYLVMQYFHNLPLQTIFQWNAGTHPNVMFYPDGSWWEKTKGIKRAIDFINVMPVLEPEAPDVAVVLPRRAIAHEGHDFKSYQYKFDDVIWDLQHRQEKTPVVVWSDEVRPATNPALANLFTTITEVIYIGSGLDSLPENSMLRAWQKAGGSLNFY